jgi:hypothetical protein
VNVVCMASILADALEPEEWTVLKFNLVTSLALPPLDLLDRLGRRTII